MKYSYPTIPLWLRHILHRVTTDQSLVRAVRRTSTQQAKFIGRGYFRCARRIGDLVVKRAQPRNAWFQTNTERNLKIHFAPTLVVNGWDVQRYYRPVPEGTIEWVWKLPGDIKPSGCGYDSDGTLVCFDW